MAIERLWESTGPVLFSANGGADGTITLNDTCGFKVKQTVVVSAVSLPDIVLEVKRVISPTKLLVGPKVSTGKMIARQNLSAYTTALLSTVRAEEQQKPKIPPQDIIQAAYEQEPTLAHRTVQVDEYGDFYNKKNPAPSLTEFIRNGSPQVVIEDTSDPSNNRPLPVKLTGFDGDVVINSENLNLETQNDGFYDSDDNSVPDSIGLISHERSLQGSSNKTKQTQRITAIRGSVNTDTVSQDVSLHDDQGNAYTAANPLPITSEKIIKQLQAPLDFFGNQSVSIRTNQIEVPLDDTNWTTFIDVTNVSTGNATQANGQVTLTTGTNANGRYAILSKDYVKYRPNSEIGWGFTWNFPVASTATSVIRIGVTDNVNTWDNSVYFGHENGVFSLIYRRSNSTIFSVAPAAWLDKCDGSAESDYVDFNGNPVILDITKDQLARIRAGLFGHAGFVVELLAPNQTWVKIYEFGNINTSNVPVFANFDLKIGAEVKKISGGSSVYTLSSACWAGWTGSVLTRMDAPISDRTLAQVTRTVIEGKSSSGGGTYIPVKVNPSGSLETSLGDIGGVAGQEIMANSLPVTIASDQTPIPMSLNPLAPNEVGFKKEFVDPFNRLISSEPVQIGSMDHRIGKHSDYWDELLTGSATSVHNVNTVSVDMTCTTGATDSVVRQTFRQFEYKKGNSQSIYITAILGAVKANTLKQVGYFDDRNGVFFETDSTDFKVVRRSFTSGSVVDFPTTQSNFNLDRVNGAGGIYNPSGINLDLTKEQVFFIEFSWLGANIIDFGVIINGKKIIMHRLSTSNSLVAPWSQSGQLPIRAYIKNLATTATPTTLSISCVGVFSNGASNDLRQVRTISSGTTALTVNVTEKVVAGIRLKPALRNIGAEPVSYDILPLTGTGTLYYKIIWRPVLTGDTWLDYSESAQILTNNPTYTGGIIMDQGHISLASTSRARISIQALSDVILGYSIANIPDSLIIVAQTDTGTGSFHFDGAFREIV